MGKPTAAPRYFPYIMHRTMADVMFDEKMDEWHRRPRTEQRVPFKEWRKAG